MTPELQTCEFVPITTLVPDHWRAWFWDQLSESAPFSWGDNNRALVTAERVLEHCERFLPNMVEDGALTEAENADFVATLERLGLTYIDLEN